MEKYIVLKDYKKNLVRFEETEKEVSGIQVFNGVDFVNDPSISEIIRKGKKFNVMATIGEYIEGERINQEIATRLAEKLNGGSQPGAE